MKNNSPNTNLRHILIVCEGYEETEYIKRLIECGVWDSEIVVTAMNAKSISNIYSVYTYSAQKYTYDAVVIFCDTEEPPYTQFENLKKRISDAAKPVSWDKIIIFANPCTMQIVLSHFGYVRLRTNDKYVNSGKIKELTGVENYKAGDKQRFAVMRQITPENYGVMKKNIEKLDGGDYTVTPSTNVLTLFHALENLDSEWLNVFGRR
ncbi:MAG: RloB domain-containing protein [Clostridia bacterium]|nr:RloB domain-containing protein [Clostridia bacterium]